MEARQPGAESGEWRNSSRMSTGGITLTPLQLRIQQTIKSQEGIIMAYRIANLLQFYLVTMRKTIGEDALLCKAIQE
jgi:hypothetical protein